MFQLTHFEEPLLLFRYDQAVEDPRDGLTLFGPLLPHPHGIKAGVVGTEAGIDRFRHWCEKIQNVIPPVDPDDEQFCLSHPPFPGFESAFRVPWDPEPAIVFPLKSEELDCIYIQNAHERVFKTVDVYANRIIKGVKEEDPKVDVWFVVAPDAVHRYCRPKSRVESQKALPGSLRVSPQMGRKLSSEGSLFAELLIDAEPYNYEPNFHNQLKARLLSEQLVPVQIIRESTIAHRDFLNAFGRPTRNLDTLQPNIAWNICTTAYYKAGGQPWKMAAIRKGVCYIGLVFKRDDRNNDNRMACCAAQMFLDSGDGVVFKGAVGPWYSAERGEFHLDIAAAKNLVERAIKTYKELDQRRGGNGDPPSELFIHGKARFMNGEWDGFLQAASSNTKTVGVQIRTAKMLKLYRDGDYPTLRGLAFLESDRKAYLWTHGFIPRAQNYLGKEVPNGLLVDVCRGEADLQVVLKDIMALTKLNYNACRFSDAQPVTLRFADAVGEILTAGPVENPPSSFKYYI